MPYKDRELKRAHDRARKKKFKASYVAHKNKVCHDCGRPFPYYVLEFDHCRGTKLFDIGDASRLFHRWDDPKLQAELAKCDLVCGNCHNARTHLRACKDLDCMCQVVYTPPTQ